MKKVAYICVHNSCRSQMAEALGKKLASDVLKVTPPARKPNRISTPMLFVL